MSREPLTAIPAAKSSPKALRIRQRIIISSVLIAAALGPLTAIYVFAFQKEPTYYVTETFPTGVTSFAEQIATDFLSGRQTDLPTANGVEATFGFPGGRGSELPVDTMTLQRVTSSSVGGRTLFSTTFRVRLIDGTFWDLVISTTGDSQNRTILAAAPSLIPSVLGQAGDVDRPLPAGDVLVDPVPAAVITAVGNWAAPFAADNRSQLSLVIPGGPSDGQYVGLGGFSISSQPRVLALRDMGDGSAYARVLLVLEPEGANGSRMSTEFDVLVSNHASPDPRVTAWGPPGTGPTLTPYQNFTR